MIVASFANIGESGLIPQTSRYDLWPPFQDHKLTITRAEVPQSLQVPPMYVYSLFPNTYSYAKINAFIAHSRRLYGSTVIFAFDWQPNVNSLPAGRRALHPPTEFLCGEVAREVSFGNLRPSWPCIRCFSTAAMPSHGSVLSAVIHKANPLHTTLHPFGTCRTVVRNE
jgi:hypothetical protein